MVNHTHKRVIRSGNGGAQECWVEEQITGEEFHCASVQKILKEKVLMVWVMTGQLVTKTTKHIMMKTTNFSEYLEPMKDWKTIRTDSFFLHQNLVFTNCSSNVRQQ